MDEKMMDKQRIIELMHLYWNDGSDLEMFTSRWMEELAEYSEHAVEAAYSFVREYFRHDECTLQVFSSLCKRAERGALVRQTAVRDGLHSEFDPPGSAPYCWKLWL